MAFDVEKVRRDFNILNLKVHDRTLVYLDSAATTLKPKCVVDRVARHYEFESSNVHRGVHFLSNQATQMFEEAREVVRAFINAGEDEVVFTHGTTESINIVARGFQEVVLQPGDEILITEIEHHSNIVPWQMAAEKTKAKVVFVPLSSSGELKPEEFEKFISARTKIVALTAMSNTLGTITPFADVIQLCKKKKIPVLIDAAQAVSNLKIDVDELGCDFLVFSAHKLFGPTGVGVLYGRSEWLNRLPPVYGGGAMIESVTKEGATFLSAPFKFEAGTPHVAGVIGAAEAIRYFTKLDHHGLRAHEQELTNYALEKLLFLNDIKVLGLTHSKAPRGPILSFVSSRAHHHDLGSLLDQEGVAVRTGHHCTQPLMKALNVTGTVRASFSIYTTKQEIDRLIEAIQKALKILG